MAKKEEQKSALESSEVLAEQLSKTEEFVERNKNIIAGVVVAIAVVIGGYFFWDSQRQEAESDAQAEMFNAQFYFEADSLNKALEGDGSNLGFLDIIDEYDGTKAANLSRFYIGVIYMNQGKFDDAITYLKEFSSSDLLIQARAYALLGDAEVESGNLDEGVEYYRKAASYRENEQFTPIYLMKLGIALEAKSDFSGAAEAYDKIITEFPKAQEVNDAKKRKAKAEGLKS